MRQVLVCLFSFIIFFLISFLTREHIVMVFLSSALLAIINSLLLIELILAHKNIVNLKNALNQVVCQVNDYNRRQINRHKQVAKIYRSEFIREFEPIFQDYFNSTPIDKYVCVAKFGQSGSLKIGNDDLMVDVDLSLLAKDTFLALDQAKKIWEKKYYNEN